MKLKYIYDENGDKVAVRVGNTDEIGELAAKKLCDWYNRHELGLLDRVRFKVNDANGPFYDIILLNITAENPLVVVYNYDENYAVTHHVTLDIHDKIAPSERTEIGNIIAYSLKGKALHELTLKPYVSNCLQAIHG